MMFNTPALSLDSPLSSAACMYLVKGEYRPTATPNNYYGGQVVRLGDYCIPGICFVLYPSNL